MAKEKNILVDEKGFLECMNQQKERSRSQSDFKILEDNVNWVSKNDDATSVFVGYSDTASDVKIVNFRQSSDKNYELILDETPFYAESGGQIGDTGYIKNNSLVIKVLDTQKRDGHIIHFGALEEGEVSLGQQVYAAIDKDRRLKIRSNHTATHLLHESLKQVLGNHVQQSGSLVSDQKLRFDLTHYEKIDQDQIEKIEGKVNRIIRENYEICTTIQNFDEAKKSGAVALFGEKYGDKVRVVDIPGFSKELCGGTHVSRTGDIGVFKIISESSLSTGVRRIEAITGQEVMNRIYYMNSIIEESKINLRTTEDQIIEKTLSLITKNKELEKKIKSGGNSSVNFDNIISCSQNLNDVQVILYDMKDYDGDLKQLGDQFRNKFNKEKGILILSSISDVKINFMCAMTDAVLTDIDIDAITICKKLGNKINGGGGGKPHLATAGGKYTSKTPEIFDYIHNYLKSIIMKG